MLQALQLLATFCAALFAGAALYIDAKERDDAALSIEVQLHAGDLG